MIRTLITNTMNTAEKLKHLTGRLDHMVPDPDLSAAENQAASAELAAISSKLYWLLPDPSLSPFERIERLARVVENRTPDMAQLQSAATKLKQIQKRMNELLPGEASLEKKVDVLIAKLNQMVGPGKAALVTIQKLELLGDPRAKIAPEK